MIVLPTATMMSDASSLTIIWYQDGFGIDPAIRSALREIDWDRHAVDWDYE